MDVWRLTVAALRRWYILLPLLALTGVAALQAGDGIRPEYEVGATAMLVPPQTSSEITNPYGGLSGTNGIVEIVLNSDASRTAISEQGLNPNYQVEAASRTTILRFYVRDATPQGGIATLEAVMALAEVELQTRQDSAGLPARAQYGIETLAAPTVASVVTDGKMRIMAIIGVLGAALSLLAAVLFDDLVGLVKRWRRKGRDRRVKKRAAAVSKAEPDATDDPGTDEQAEDRDGDDVAAEPASAAQEEQAQDPEDDSPGRRDVSGGGEAADADHDRLARAGRDG